IQRLGGRRARPGGAPASEVRPPPGTIVLRLITILPLIPCAEPVKRRAGASGRRLAPPGGEGFLSPVKEGSPMKKWLTSVVAVAVFGFVGCGKGSGDHNSAKVKGGGGKELTLTVPAGVAIKAGGSADLAITIERKGFDEDVAVKVEDLPKGVSVEGGSAQKIDKGAKEKKLTLKAAEDAGQVKDHVTKVTASFKDGEKDDSATQTFKLTVDKK